MADGDASAQAGHHHAAADPYRRALEIKPDDTMQSQLAREEVLGDHRPKQDREAAFGSISFKPAGQPAGNPAGK